jgi:2-oxoglutarate ferredoxin oxidoreductase subunit beta
MTDVQLTRKDFASDQEVRWCPGCGDYAILATVQGVMPELGVPRENVVFVSGIGCAARFPYYMNTYGFHGIHGRAPAIATGISETRRDLEVFVVTGDGDALSIGGNHLIHAMRRNVDLTILLFNNQIYGLTKGQYSPTSEFGKVTKSTPEGSLDHPFNPISLAIGSEATFVARTIDTERAHLTEMLQRAARHEGAALIEIYQNCNIFNDGAFDAVRKNEPNQIRLEHGRPVRFGENGQHGVVLTGSGELEIVDVGDAEPAEGEEPGTERRLADPSELLVHDAHREDASLAFALSRLAHTPLGPTPMGLFRQVERPVYGDELNRQLDDAALRKGPGDLQALITGSDTWTVPG